MSWFLHIPRAYPPLICTNIPLERLDSIASRSARALADLPGLRAFSANLARDKIEEREIPQPMVKSAARLGAPKPSYGHFSQPAGHGRGKFSSRKTPKMGDIPIYLLSIVHGHTLSCDGFDYGLSGINAAARHGKADRS